MQVNDLDDIANNFDDVEDLDLETDNPDDDSFEETDDFETHASDEQTEEDSDLPEGEDEQSAEGSDDEQRIVLSDGSEVPLSEIEGQMMMRADYTRKTTELAEERKQFAQEQGVFAERSQYVEATLGALLNYAQGLLPEPPNLELARTNPGDYQYQKGMYEQAVEEFNQLVRAGQLYQSQQQSYSEQDLAQLSAAEDAKLLEAMPHLSQPKSRAAFDKTIQSAAQKFGFSEDEISGAVDHRVRRMAYYAGLGMKSEENRKNAKNKAPSPKQGKGRRVEQKSVSSAIARRARQRLSKSGSLEDALGIDFD